VTNTGIFPDDNWSVGQGETERGPIIIRVRGSEPNPADRALFTKLIFIRWEFEARDASGLPTSEEMAQMDQFEDRVLEESDRDPSWGSGVAVITHDGVREWRFYTPDTNLFQKRFSACLDGLGPYPLDLEVFDDPEWNGFYELLQS